MSEHNTETVTDIANDIERQAFDALSGMYDLEQEIEAEQANDETREDAERCQALEREDAEFRAGLNDPEQRRWILRKLALYDGRLTHAQFRVLCHLLERADQDLSNVFESNEAAAEKLGLSPSIYKQHLAALRKAGWVRMIPHRRDGGQWSSSGVKFCVPAGVLPLGDPWDDGPERFHKRGRNRAPRK